MSTRSLRLASCSFVLALLPACSTSGDGPDLMPSTGGTFTGGGDGDSAASGTGDTSSSTTDASGGDGDESTSSTDSTSDSTGDTTGSTDDTTGSTDDTTGSTDDTTGSTDDTTTGSTDDTTGSTDGTTGGDGDGDSACDGSTAVGTGGPALIDDFEDGNLTIPANDMRSGTWSSWSDGTGTLSPDMTISDIADGVNGSTKALNFAGTGFTSWGAGTGPTLYTQGCYDFSAYSGVSFYAKGSGLLRMAVATADTHEFYDCDSGSEECSNHYHAPDITLSDTWTEYSYSWDQLMQPSWGPTKPFDQTKGVSLSFSHIADAGGGPDFDIWLDDVTFTTN